MTEIEQLRVCMDFAAIAHDGQYRKDGKTPYFVHPARVVMLSMQHISSGHIWLFDDKYPEHVRSAAAWNHDIIEDCTTAHGMIRNHGCTFDEFMETLPDGQAIKELVIALTHNQDLPRDERKTDSYSRLVDNPVAGQIKLCDRIDNLATLKDLTPNNQKYYIKDTTHMIETVGERVKVMNFSLYNKICIELERAKNAI